MKRISGRYVTTTTVGESIQAFIPEGLPPREPQLTANSYEKQNLLAELALAQLSGVSKLVPSINWLLYGAIRKEALLTSQIEGTQATLTDLFDDEAGIKVINTDDVEEVTNYIKAFQYVQENLKKEGGLPISIRLLCNAHQLLMNGVRGNGKQPGELRKSQNWIGSKKPSRAIFVPPPPEKVAKLLSDLEKFIHEDRDDFPPLVKIALVHAQFETIHPFLDGNGRLGRLLIAALVEYYDLLPEPLMYLSAHLKQNQSEYYRLLNGVRTEGDWESWIQFFLEGVIDSAITARKNIVEISTRIYADKNIVMSSSEASLNSLKLFDLLPTMPRFTIEKVKTVLGVTYPTANAAVKNLIDLGLIIEITGQTRNRSFSYQTYIDLISD